MIGAVIQGQQRPAAPLPHALPVAPLRREPDAAMAMVPFEALGAPWPGLNPLPPAAAIGTAIQLEQLPAPCTSRCAALLGARGGVGNSPV